MFKELDTKGYVICKSIFPKELLEEYYQRYLINQHKFVNQNYKVVDLPQILRWVFVLVDQLDR